MQLLLLSIPLKHGYRYYDLNKYPTWLADGKYSGADILKCCLPRLKSTLLPKVFNYNPTKEPVVLTLQYLMSRSVISNASINVSKQVFILINNFSFTYRSRDLNSSTAAMIGQS